MPANLVPTAVINVDSKIAAAIRAEPINIGIEAPGRWSVMTTRGALYSWCLFGDWNKALMLRSSLFCGRAARLEAHLADLVSAPRRCRDALRQQRSIPNRPIRSARAQRISNPDAP